MCTQLEPCCAKGNKKSTIHQKDIEIPSRVGKKGERRAPCETTIW
jgi:hypothetical protein